MVKVGEGVRKGAFAVLELLAGCRPFSTGKERGGGGKVPLYGMVSGCHCRGKRQRVYEAF